MSRDEIVERFTLEAVSVSPGTFDYAKLDWMNGVYLRALHADATTPTGSSCGSASRGSTGRPSASTTPAPIVQEKIGRLDEFPGFAGFLFHDVEPDPALLDARVLRAAEAALGRSSRGPPRRSRSRSSSSARTSARSRARSTARSGSP